MSVALRLFDETSSRQRTGQVILRVASERITVRELIERRVRQEVAEHRASNAERTFLGLVQPPGQGSRAPAQSFGAIDADKQVETALAAFERNGFLLLVADEQVDDLDAEIVVSEGLAIHFIKLVPLVGG